MYNVYYLYKLSAIAIKRKCKHGILVFVKLLSSLHYQNRNRVYKMCILYRYIQTLYHKYSTPYIEFGSAFCLCTFSLYIFNDDLTGSDETL
jgi:hypothetical protein